MTTNEECEHRWVYQGTVYSSDDRPLPGTGARERVYFDRFYCQLCLASSDRNARRIGNTYQNPIAGTFPA